MVRMCSGACGDFSIFFSRPISLTLIVIAGIFTIVSTLRMAAGVRGAEP